MVKVEEEVEEEKEEEDLDKEDKQEGEEDKEGTEEEEGVRVGKWKQKEEGVVGEAAEYSTTNHPSKVEETLAQTTKGIKMKEWLQR